MKRPVIAIIAVLLGAGLTWVFPLFHVVSLEKATAAKSHEKFDAALFTRDFWDKQLVPTFNQAHEVAEVIAAVKSDPEVARKTFGKSVGIGRVYFYFLRGEGTVLAVEKSSVTMNCVAPDDEPNVILKTGLLFGNTIRDATGQLQASDFANSQDFNAISKELNRIVEEQVQPKIKARARVGGKIRFVGCAEVRASSKNLLPFTVVPLEVEFPE